MVSEEERVLNELKQLKQSFKDNFESENISTQNVEFRNMPQLLKQMEKILPSQTKTITPTKSPQNVSADEGYKLTSVEVGAIPDNYIEPTGTLPVTENGIKDVTQYKSIDVNVASSGGGDDMLQALVDATNDTSYLLYNKFDITNVDFLSNLDTSNVTNMRYMFYSCAKLTTIPQLDTSNVIYMGNMFFNCSKLTTIPQLDTSNVTDMGNMFYSCAKLTTIPQLNTRNVTTMSNMFRGCSNLTTIPQLDTSNVTTMSNMFNNCSSLTALPQLNTSNVTTMSNMFNNCSNLTTISLLNMINVTDAKYIFDGCAKIENITLKNIKASLEIGNNYSLKGRLLTVDSLVNTIKELWDYSSDTTTHTLTMGNINLEKIASTYVKLIDVTDEMIAEDEYIASKKPCVVCESTDEGAMLITDYVGLKNWSLA